ncbi:exodeoxyribonuclease VII small subunit [Humidesulfovibrio sp.]
MAKDKMNFEQRLERLKAVVDSLERGDLPLDKALTLYKEGLGLSAELGRTLDTAKNEVKLVQDGLLKEFAALEAEAEA